MVDILHRVGIVSPTPEKVYDALTTVGGLAGWWTDDVTGSSDVGDVLEFRFPPVGGFDMEVLELRPCERVVWRVVDGPEEWIGTTIEIPLSITLRNPWGTDGGGNNDGSDDGYVTFTASQFTGYFNGATASYM